MTKHEKALIRAALIWHAVTVLNDEEDGYRLVTGADKALAKAARGVLTKRPKRLYANKRKRRTK